IILVEDRTLTSLPLLNYFGLVRRKYGQYFQLSVPSTLVFELSVANHSSTFLHSNLFFDELNYMFYKLALREEIMNISQYCRPRC
ncbi:hypothetical protein, partial [Bacillus pacificus]|uniref:hypothetical protein n=1 Tax=Bacillus pacificus TaxID=2026187 RepID=UPI002D798D81